MTPVLILTGLSFLTLVILLWMYLRLATPRDWHTDLELWWSEFDPSRYEAMARLLNREDTEFLRTLPGFRPGMEKRLRRQRLQAFDCFLREIAMDFHRLHALGSQFAMSTMSAEMHNELFHQRLRFSRAMWRIRLELLAYRLGLGDVDPAALVDSLRVTTNLFRPLLAGAAS